MWPWRHNFGFGWLPSWVWRYPFESGLLGIVYQWNSCLPKQWMNEGRVIDGWMDCHEYVESHKYDPCVVSWWLDLESSYGPATKQTEETSIRYRQPWTFGQCVTMNHRYSIDHQGAIIICYVDPACVRECTLPGPFVLQLRLRCAYSEAVRTVPNKDDDINLVTKSCPKIIKNTTV